MTTMRERWTKMTTTHQSTSEDEEMKTTTMTREREREDMG